MIQNQLDKEFLKEIRGRQELDEALREVEAGCIECGICVKQCAFLTRYGTPKKIAQSCFPGHENPSVAEAFECSLCSLCTAVCPVKVDPRQMFLAMRRYGAASGRTDFARQKPLINFEKRGVSRRFSFYGLPAGCDIILFPGCALSGTRPQRVMQLYEHLRHHYPNLGIVLDCCTKPSHDLGRTDFFQAMFSELLHYLVQHNIKSVLTACPSCHAVFKQYGKGLTTRSIYEILARENWSGEALPAAGPVTIQDSCAARFDKEVRTSVRRLVKACSVPCEEMEHHGEKTLCCGEGGGAHFAAPQLAGSWTEMRRQEAGSRRIITYCAGCANFLTRAAPTLHLLDLLFAPAAALAGKVKVARPPFTYLNRLRLKRKFRKKLHYACSRERTFSWKPPQKSEK